MDSIRSYVLSIVAAALLCGICQSFWDHKSATGAIVRTITGLLVAITVLSPIVNLEIGDLTKYFSSLQTDADAIVSAGEEIGQTERARIITQQCEAYILDKADRLGLSLKVQVQLAENDSLQPETATLQGTASPYAKSVLGTYITESLGIPEEKQIWIIK